MTFGFVPGVLAGFGIFDRPKLVPNNSLNEASLNLGPLMPDELLGIIIDVSPNTRLEKSEEVDASEDSTFLESITVSVGASLEILDLTKRVAISAMAVLI